MIAAAALLTGPASPAAAQGTTCPNADIRAQQSAEHLLDCRAYEQVSPVDKNDTDIGSGFDPGPILSSPDGAAVAYTSLAAFAGGEAAGLPNGYASTRGADSWETFPLTPPIDPQGFFGNATTSPIHGASVDFTKQLVSSAAALAPGAVVDDRTDLYVHDSSDDSYEHVASVDHVNPALTGVRLGGASTDGSHFFFFTRSSLAVQPETTPPAPTGVFRNLFEWSNGELKLVGILPDGSAHPDGAVPAGDRAGIDMAQNAVSDDGGRVYWQPSRPGSVPVYLREDEQTVAVTVRQSDGSTQPGRYWYATPDGSHAFITSNAQLTADASPAGADLYRYDADADQLTDLTLTAGAAEVLGVLGVSDDGSRAYFVAEGELASGATAGEANLYAWHDGAGADIRFIGTLTSGDDLADPLIDDQVGDWRVSPNGRFLGFSTASEIAGPNPHDPQPFRQAYLYDSQAESLACASCPPDGAEPSGEARLQVEIDAIRNVFGESQAGLTRNVLDSGQLFFHSPDALASGDTNGKLDVYQYADGEVDLISSGQSASDSFFGDASRSGDDVFILTRSQLVGQDRDDLYDLYDARVGGGIPSQSPPPPEPGCEGGACQGEPSASPPAAESGSSQFTGPGSTAEGGADEGASRRCTRLDEKADTKQRKAKWAKRAFKRAKRKARRADGKRAKRLGKKADRKKDRFKKKRRKARRAKRKARSCGTGEARRARCAKAERKADRAKREARRFERNADRAHGKRARRLERKADRKGRQAKQERRRARRCERGAK